MDLPIYPQTGTGIAYSHQHSLQNLTACLTRPQSSAENKIWVVYIHGGAWRAPSQSSADLLPAMHLLLNDPAYSSTRENIAGFASINYGLSSSPDSSNTDASRNIKHPGHINDVLKALNFLSQNCGVGRSPGFDWLLVGHSCGATLAFQAAFSINASSGGESIRAPRAIVGIEGLYDLPALVQYHAEEPFYRQFIADAFGEDESVWKAESPATPGERLDGVWGASDLVLLAHSREDELVEWEQVDAMRNAMETHRPKGEVQADVQVLELSGTHDEVWEEGKGVANAIQAAMERLFSRSS
jgi:acetyl esterase/lipase